MEIPNEIVNKIMLYNSHPLADMIRELQYEYNELKKTRLLYPECDPIPFHSMCFSLILYKQITRKFKV